MPARTELDILYQDDDFVAVNKPNGLLVHRTRMAADVEVFALQLVRNLVKHRVYPIHRLDRPTSGVLIFGQRKEAAAALAESFREHDIDKTYAAITRGWATEEVVVDKPLRKDLTGPEQDAQTTYWRIATATQPYPIDRYPSSRYSLMKAKPQTGRMHQIRRHLAHLRYPIIGDKDYGDRHHNRHFREALDLPHLLLHAQSLSFLHPFTQKQTTISASPPASFTSALALMNWENAYQQAFEAKTITD